MKVHSKPREAEAFHITEAAFADSSQLEAWARQVGVTCDREGGTIWVSLDKRGMPPIPVNSDTWLVHTGHELQVLSPDHFERMYEVPAKPRVMPPPTPALLQERARVEQDIDYLRGFGCDVVASLSLVSGYDLKRLAHILSSLFGQHPVIEYKIIDAMLVYMESDYVDAPLAEDEIARVNTDFLKGVIEAPPEARSTASDVVKSYTRDKLMEGVYWGFAADLLMKVLESTDAEEKRQLQIVLAYYRSRNHGYSGSLSRFVLSPPAAAVALGRFVVYRNGVLKSHVFTSNASQENIG